VFVDICHASHYNIDVIRSFRSKVLAALWSKGRTPKMDAQMQRRVLRRLDALEAAERIEDMDLPGLHLHALEGLRPVRYSIRVNTHWRVAFEFEDGHAYRVDFEQYH
jgi:proteic killer suppression protein